MGHTGASRGEAMVAMKFSKRISWCGSIIGIDGEMVANGRRSAVNRVIERLSGPPQCVRSYITMAFYYYSFVHGLFCIQQVIQPKFQFNMLFY